jgi:predicted Zn-dependent protease
MRAAPDNARYAYVYGVALHDRGNVRDAVAVLEAALRRRPADQDLLAALAAYAGEAGDTRRAKAYAKRLAQLRPAASPSP